MKFEAILAILLCWGLFVGCANMPTAYGQWVTITDGQYKGMRGTLVGDCEGFERYKIFIPMLRHYVCVRSWNMERIQ